MTLMVFRDYVYTDKFTNLLILLMSISVLTLPKYSTKIILVYRLIACICIVYTHIQLFEGKDVCYSSIDFFKKFFVKRQFTVNIYIIISIYVTPFLDQYFLTWFMTTVFFAIEYFMVEKYSKDDEW